MKFNGSLEDLKKLIKFLCDSGEDDWQELSSSLYQFKCQDGGTINFNSQTNDLALRGKGNKNIKNEQKADHTTSKRKVEQSSVGETSISECLKEKCASKDETFDGSELVIALVGALGTNLDQIVSIIIERLEAFNYVGKEIKISKDVIGEVADINNFDSNFDRISSLMNLGNKIRKNTSDKAVLAKAAAAKVNLSRDADGEEKKPFLRHAFIINSLKNPEEVQELRRIYSNGIFLIGVYSNLDRRLNHLTKNKRIKESDAKELIKRD